MFLGMILGAVLTLLGAFLGAAIVVAIRDEPEASRESSFRIVYGDADGFAEETGGH